MPRYDKFRATEVVLSGDNPVIVGYVTDFISPEDNRLFTMREYSLSGASATREWYYNYTAGEYDDDGYTITSYKTEDTPPEERFIGAGFHQYDLEGVPQNPEPAGLTVLLDEDGDTVCAPHTFRETWYNACCRDVVYIGGLNAHEEVYSSCSWYFDSDTVMRGFIEIAYEDTEISLIEDSGIDGSWEKILFDSEEDLLVLGGFQDPDQDGFGDLRVGCIDLTSTPYEITEQDDWGDDDYVFLEGPLLQVDDGLYICISNGSYEDESEDSHWGIGVTFWNWDSHLSPSLILKDSDIYTTDDDFDGYKNVSAIGIAFDDSVDPENLVVILEAVTDDNSEDYYILVAKIPVDVVNMTLGSLTISSELEVIPESGYTVSASDFYFSSINPVEGVGCGAADYSANSQKFWIFRIEDD
ncbi:MAG: hypothetical protein U9P42_00075 [Candidatus Fermentibacteria bacterium]|nr:hypothetical protein [Candidatus Fermentibacteria bacterium]